MKRTSRMKFLALGWLVALLVMACTKQDKTDCNSPSYIAAFKLINRTTSLSQVNTWLVGAGTGDNFQTVIGTNGAITRSWRWYPCSDKKYYIRCTFLDDSLTSCSKTLRDSGCSSQINADVFGRLDTTLTYTQIVSILGSPGDVITKTFSKGGVAVENFRFYDCNDGSRYFSINFRNRKAYSFGKNFIY